MHIRIVMIKMLAISLTNLIKMLILTYIGNFKKVVIKNVLRFCKRAQNNWNRANNMFFSGFSSYN